VPAAALQLASILPVDYPQWYIVTRALVALVQVGIGIAMLRVWRHCGVWGDGRRYSRPYAGRG
jgi:hypothetical protein